MPLGLRKQEFQDVTVLHMSGALKFGEVDIVWQEAAELLAQNRKFVILNMAEITFVDSVGIGELVGAFSQIQREG